jgi:hypothetical protein
MVKMHVTAAKILRALSVASHRLPYGISGPTWAGHASLTAFEMNTSTKPSAIPLCFARKMPANSSRMNTSKNSPVTYFRMNTYRQPKPVTIFRMNTYAKMGRGEGSYCYLNCYPSKPAQPPARRTAPAPVRRIAHRYPMAPFSFTVSGVSNAQGRIPQDCARSGGFFL